MPRRITIARPSSSLFTAASTFSNGSSSGPRCCVLSASTIARAATTSLSRRPGTSLVAKGVRLRSLSVASTGSRWKRLPRDATRRSTFGRETSTSSGTTYPGRLTRAASVDRPLDVGCRAELLRGHDDPGAGAAREGERPGESRLDDLPSLCRGQAADERAPDRHPRSDQLRLRRQRRRRRGRRGRREGRRRGRRRRRRGRRRRRAWSARSSCRRRRPRSARLRAGPRQAARRRRRPRKLRSSARASRLSV